MAKRTPLPGLRLINIDRASAGLPPEHVVPGPGRTRKRATKRSPPGQPAKVAKSMSKPTLKLIDLRPMIAKLEREIPFIDRSGAAKRPRKPPGSRPKGTGRRRASQHGPVR